MNIVFLGPPGSGKGTQAKQLADTTHLIHLATGDIFREAVRAGTPLGKKIEDIIHSGKLVPDELVSRVVFEKLQSMKRKTTGFLLDGYPRTLDQARAFDRFSQQSGIPIDVVLFLDVEFDELVKRLAVRRQCPKCKEVYNLEIRPPRVEGLCDRCGTELIHRLDDHADIVLERLEIYRSQTEPLRDFYKNHPGFHRINAAQSIEKVSADIQAALDSHPAGK